MNILNKSNVEFILTIVGDFSSDEFKNYLYNLIDFYNLGSFIIFKGVLTGKAKHQEFINADIFCFPSYFESESFGLVAVEAMQFKLPVILSNWRGLSSLITHGNEGLYVNINAPVELANSINFLIDNPLIRKQMGLNGRIRYLTKYTDSIFKNNINSALNSL